MKRMKKKKKIYELISGGAYNRDEKYVLDLMGL